MTAFMQTVRLLAAIGIASLSATTALAQSSARAVVFFRPTGIE